MNVRQQLYKKYRLEGLSAYKSAIKAGYSHNTAWNAHKNIESRCDFSSLFAKAGLDDAAVINLIIEGANANKPISCDVFIRDENGELKVNKNSNDWIEYQDWNARHKFIETYLELVGLLKKNVLVDNSKHEHKTFVQVYVPEPYSKEKVNAETMETSSRLTDRSV